MKRIANWNMGEVGSNEVFHFKNSLRPFILIVDVYGDDDFFRDIDNGECFSFDDLKYAGLEFYTDENDENFLGVEVIAKIKWVS